MWNSLKIQLQNKTVGRERGGLNYRDMGLSRVVNMRRLALRPIRHFLDAWPLHALAATYPLPSVLFYTAFIFIFFVRLFNCSLFRFYFFFLFKKSSILLKTISQQPVIKFENRWFTATCRGIQQLAFIQFRHFLIDLVFFLFLVNINSDENSLPRA